MRGEVISVSSLERRYHIYFVTSERSKRGTKYDIVTRAIKLILPSLECINIYHIFVPLSGAKIRLCFQIIYTLSIFRHECKLLFEIYTLNVTGRNYKNKPKISYLLIPANFFLLFSLYYCILLLLSLYR